jgi:hypothetical protein
MAVEEKPPSWVPVDQHVGQVPLALSQDVHTAGVQPGSGQDAQSLASQIVRQNQPVINRFVAVQRQQVELGDKDVHNAVLPLQGMDVYYQNVQGLERVHYHISPQAEAPQPPPEQLEEPTAPAPPTPPEPLEVPEPEVPEPPEPPEPPEFKEPELPELPEPPEVPEPPEPPEVEEPPIPEPPEPPTEEHEKKLDEPEFLEIDVPFGLSVEFGDKDKDPPKQEKS